MTHGDVNALFNKATRHALILTTPTHHPLIFTHFDEKNTQNYVIFRKSGY